MQKERRQLPSLRMKLHAGRKYKNTCLFFNIDKSFTEVTGLKEKRRDYEPTTPMQKRAVLGGFGICMLLAAAVTVKLAILCIAQHDTYAEKANNKHFSRITITANRGSIYDRNGEPLARSATVYKIYIDPNQFQSDMEKIGETMKERQEAIAKGKKLSPDTIVMPIDQLREEILDTIAEKLKLDKEEVRAASEKDTKYYVLQTQVDKIVADDLMEYLDKYGLSSIKTEEDTKRYSLMSETVPAVSS